MSFLTPDQASKLKCPFARTFDAKVGAHCEGGKCIAWRWLPIQASDPRFVKAVKDEMKSIAEAKGSHNSVSFHKQAVKNVTDDPKAHGVPDAPEQGWCGLAGRPE
jgi:hypothetical protein